MSINKEGENHMIIQDFQDNKKGLRVLFHQEVAYYQKIKEQYHLMF